MIRIETDFNTREDYLTIVLPRRAPVEALVTGTRVILYEPGDIECEAIVRPGDTWPWVADIVEGTIKRPSDRVMRGDGGGGDDKCGGAD